VLDLLAVRQTHSTVHSSADRQYFFESEQAPTRRIGGNGSCCHTDEFDDDWVGRRDSRACRGIASVAVSALRWDAMWYEPRRVSAAGGLLRGTATVDVADCCVFPIAPPSHRPSHVELPDRLGTTSPAASVRRGVRRHPRLRTGDQLRTVNWPVSARRRTLHVTERFDDRAAD